MVNYFMLSSNKEDDFQESLSAYLRSILYKKKKEQEQQSLESMRNKIDDSNIKNHGF